MLKFFCIPFAASGDRAAVPDPVQVAGTVSYTEGYNFNYQRVATDPAALNIERNKMNQLYYDITNAVAELQSQGVPDFITTALNDGVAYPYAQNAVVRYSGDLYVSLAASNTALPSDATKWALLPTATRTQTLAYTSAVAAGTADAITAAFSPAPTAWPGTGTLSFLVRAGAANATTTPTFTPNSGVMAPKVIVKGSNTALGLGDIAGAGHWLQFDYDPTLDKVVLRNPAALTQAAGDGRYPLYVGDAGGTADALTATVATPLTGLYDGMVVFVDSLLANQTQTPSFNLTVGSTATGAKTITKSNGQPLGIADIPGAGARLALGYAAGTNTWLYVNAPTGRTRLAASLTLFVATTGSDANNGLTVGAPFLTLQKAFTTLQNNYDLNGYQVVVQLADGTYTGSALMNSKVVGSYGPTAVIVQGNTVTPANVVINTTSAVCVQADLGAQFQVQYLKLQTTTGGSCLACSGKGSEVWVGAGVIFGTASGGYSHAAAFTGGRVFFFNNYSITGGAGTHWYTDTTGVINAVGLTITLTGTPVFSAYFAEAATLSYIQCNGCVFTGSATGTRYVVTANAVLNTAGSGASFLPGSVAGSTSTGGQYV